MSRPSFIKKGSTRRSDDTMDDDLDDKDDTKRKSRNLSEKKRRDQFNVLINELSSMISTNARKMDKSTVLKSTISYLRNHNEIAVQSRVHEIQEDWKPSFLSNEEFTHLILEALDGFIMVFSSSGRIFYASESVTPLLGHLPSDLVNLTIYDLVYESDQSDLYNLLLNPSNLNCHDDKENQLSISCHMKRGGFDADGEVVYELIHFQGYFRSDLNPLDVENAVTSSSGLSGDADTRLVFVGTGRLQVPLLIRDIAIVDRVKNEFTSRHSLEWKFLFLDHRAPPIIGYLPFEVLGTSCYDYYHVDDLEKVVTCHEALMQKGEGTSCHYRFLMKGQQWIWLQSRFYITYHQWNSKPEFIVCTHRVVSYVDVVKHLRHKCDVNDSEDNTLEENSGLCEPAQSVLASSPWSNKSLPRSPKVRARSDSASTDSKQSHLTAHSNRSRCGVLRAPVVPTSSPQQPVQLVAMTPMVAGPPLVLTSSQSHVQEQLQRKHAQLQQLIVAQQDELRRVSEQLVMARYGLLPGLPLYTAPTSVSSTTPGLVCSPTPHTTTDMFVGSSSPLAFGTQPTLMMDPHQLNIQSHRTEEATPVQMSQQQAQLLFSLPNLPTQHR